MGRPPSFKALKGIPLFLPEALQMEHEDGFLDWVFEGFYGLIDFEPLLYQQMHVQVFDD